jgi:hypothetical protein
MRVDRWKVTNRKKRQCTVPLTIRPSQISRTLDWDRTRALEVKDHRLTARAMVRPLDHYHFLLSDSRDGTEFSGKCTKTPKSKDLP